MSGVRKGAAELLHEPGEADGAARTFEAVLSEIAAARSRIEIHMYVWRSDEVGNQVGEALIEAAERGVRVKIIKDEGALLFERTEMNRKSFFNREVPRVKRLAFRIARTLLPDTCVADDYGFECGKRLLAHPGVEVEWVNHTHTKYYVFDERVVITGSINIEDRHRGYHDYMVRIEREEDVRRFRERLAGAAPFDEGRAVDFLCNAHRAEGRVSEIKEEILRRMEAVRKSVFVEMAYLGDEEVSEAIVAAARRGVRVVVLLSRNANIGNDLNYRTMREILETSPVEVYFTAKMVHSKMILFDDEAALVGSCNLSVFSLEKAGELSLIVQGEEPLLGAIREVVLSRLRAGTRVESVEELRDYNPLMAALQQWQQTRIRPERCRPR